MTATLYSFPPLATAQARQLILGSMPGMASLAAGQYYAHPRNHFWPIMAALCGFNASADYAEKTALLLAKGIAVWDVLQSCQRPGSLDKDIARASIQANPFELFFQQYPHIQRVYFNGSHAEQLFLRSVKPQLRDDNRHYQRLPSTSPANARASYEDKLAAWRVMQTP